MGKRFLWLVVIAALAGGAQAGTPAKVLFGAMQAGSTQRSAALGGYARGCLAGAVQLPESGPTWQAMRLSRNRNWGHPALISFIERLSRKAARQRGWKGLYVGDMSQPRGGPMLSGHASHQIGLDVDIWMLPARRLDLSVQERETISSVSTRRANGAYVNRNWTRQHMNIIRAAAKDPAVARIFLFPGAKVWMCKRAGGDRRWLRKVRPWWGHHEHFHVRLVCPRGDRSCVDQPPPPPGDGCAEAEKWVHDILYPPPPSETHRTPRRQLELADLPGQCRRVLSLR